MQLVNCDRRVVFEMCERYHGYGSDGGAACMNFALMENGMAVAVFQFKPPPPGAAKKFGGSAPWGVLALSRMAAVPRDERTCKKLSKVLRRFETLIDRGRWPVLLTYSDASQGHTGHVYRCAGWEPQSPVPARYYEVDGVRVSSYSGGRTRVPAGAIAGATVLTPWVARACEHGREADFAASRGWVRMAVPGKSWKSGAQAHAIVNIIPQK